MYAERPAVCRGLAGVYWYTKSVHCIVTAYYTLYTVYCTLNTVPELKKDGDLGTVLPIFRQNHQYLEITGVN